MWTVKKLKGEKFPEKFKADTLQIKWKLKYSQVEKFGMASMTHQYTSYKEAPGGDYLTIRLEVAPTWNSCCMI